MSETYSVPVQAQSFNIVDALVGVIVRPVVTMQKIAAARPWQIALALLVVYAALGALIGLTTRIQPTTPFPPETGVSPQVAQLLALSQSRTFLILSGLTGPIFQLVYAGILFLIAKVLRGNGFFSALFSTLVFSTVPSLISVPLTLLINLVGSPVFSILLVPVSLAFSIWSYVLQVFGVRASMNLSTGRAIATVLIPIGILFFLACVLSIVLFFFVFAAISATSP